LSCNSLMVQAENKNKNMKSSNTYLAILIVTLVFVAGTAMAIPPPPVGTPDVASTSGLLACSMMGLMAVKRFFRR